MKWSSMAIFIVPVLFCLFASFLVLKEMYYGIRAIPIILVIWAVVGTMLGTFIWWHRRDLRAFNFHHDTINTVLQEVAIRNDLEFSKFADVDVSAFGDYRGQGSIAGDMSGHYVSIGLDLPSLTDVEWSMSRISLAKELDMIFSVSFREPLSLFHGEVSLRKAPRRFDEVDFAFSKYFKGKDLESIPASEKEALLHFGMGAKKLYITNYKICAVPKETQLTSVSEIDDFLLQVVALTTYIEKTGMNSP